MCRWVAQIGRGVSTKLKAIILGFEIVPFVFLVACYRINPIGYLFAPPSDLYDALCLKQVDFGKTGNSYECEYSNKYPGNHSINIVVERPSEITQKSDFPWNLKAKVEVSDDKVVLLSAEIDKPSPFWFGKYSKGGFTLVSYKAPERLPIGRVLKCKITVLKGDASFEDTYGTTSLLVTKASDK